MTENATETKDARVLEAEVKKAQAEADRARAEADKAATDAAQASRVEAEAAGEIAQKQREAEARKASAEADKAATDAGQAKRAESEASGSLAQKQREAETRKATAEANKTEFEARQAQVAAYIPDFSAVVSAPATVGDKQALFGSVLAQHALRRAATNVVASLKDKLPGVGPILVTSHEDLATSDGVYLEVNSGLRRLSEEADALIAAQPAPGEGGFAAALGAAIASAVPGLISLLSPIRTVSSFVVEIDAATAVAAVAGLLADGRQVRIDDFRLVPASALVQLERDLLAKRSQLVTMHGAAETSKSAAETTRTNKESELNELSKAIQGSPGDATLSARLTRTRAEYTNAVTASTAAAAKSISLSDLVKAIDDFHTTVHAAQPGGRSPFVVAAMLEQLHGGVDSYTAVVCIKAGSGSADQNFVGRKLFRDKFSSIASVTLSYWAIDPGTSLVIAAGSETGSVRCSGSIGGDFNIKPVQSVDS